MDISCTAPAVEDANTSKTFTKPRREDDAEVAARLGNLRVQELIAETADRFFPSLLKTSPEYAYQEATRLCNKLERMNDRFAIAMIEGKTVVLDMYSTQPPTQDTLSPLVIGATIPRAYPCAVTFSDLEKLHMDELVTVHIRKDEARMNVATAWLQWPGHRKYERGLVFAPGASQGAVPEGWLNLFTGWSMSPQSPDREADEEACAEFLRHLLVVVCGSDQEVYQWLLWWMADIVQNPQDKPGSAVVLAGKKGTGKSFVADVLREVIGQKYFIRVAKKRDLVGEFSGHLAAGLLVNCEEATFGGDIEANNILKDMITSPTVLVNEKYMPRHTMRSYARFLFTTNSDYSHNTSEDERRFLFLDVSDVYVGDTAYFENMKSQLDRGGYQAFANILHTMKRPEGVNLRKPPKTEAHARLFAESLPIEDRFFYNALVTGEGFPEEAEENGALVSVSSVKTAFDLYLEEHAKGRSFKKSDNNFVPNSMAKFWGVDPESRDRPRRGGKREVCYFVPSLKDAQERATWSIAEGGLGLPRELLGLETEDEG